jgi:CBS-domain-containing membrane protein
MNFLTKLRGDSAALPPRAPGKAVALAFVGGFLAIAVIALLAQSLHVALVLGSFGASCVLVFGYPDVPFSQPRNVVLGICSARSSVSRLCICAVRTGGAWRSRSAAPSR